MAREVIKEIRQKGFELFNNTGRLPSKIKINREELDKITATKGIQQYLAITKEEMYIDGLLVVIDDCIERFKVAI